MKINSTISKNLRFYRLKQELTLEKLAEHSDLSSNYLSDIERGKKNPSLKSLEKICNALGIKMHNLFLEKTEAPYDITDETNHNLKDLIASLPDYKKEKLLIFIQLLEKSGFL